MFLDKITGILSPNVSPLVSFQYHPRFKVAHQVWNFDTVTGFMDAWIDSIFLISSGYSNDELLIRLGACAGHLFQCNQVCGLVNWLIWKYNIFRPLTEFESLLVSPKLIKGLLSKVYRILIHNKEIKDESKLYWETDLSNAPWRRISPVIG